MAHIVIEQSGIKVLTNGNKPEAFWAVPGVAEVNPFKDDIEYLDKARGRWWQQNEYKLRGSERDLYRSGREAFLGKVADEFGQSTEVAPIYMSPYFDTHELPIESLTTAFGLFAALGKYIEVIQYEVFVKIADADYEDNVPSYIPFATWQNEQEEVINTKWSEWKRPGFNHTDPGDGFKYIPLRAMTAKYLAGSILVQLLANGYTLGYIKDLPQLPSGE